ncbi:MAG: hypothetical protein EXS50_00175 [Candidatus Taylorbacteria bacterium]|nr:hypothetical protein [Candidatus Taylorbacteria bacterium]
MKKIFHEKTLIGIHITDIDHGSNAVTDASHSLQVVTLKYPKGASTKIHQYSGAVKKTVGIQKHIIVINGKIKIDLYIDENTKVNEIIIGKGESFILIEGGWKINFIEDSELIETKNGPFVN